MFYYETDKDGQDHLAVKKPLENTMILVIGSTGGGKTVFTQLLSQVLSKEYDYTIIIVTTKKGSERDHAFANFPPNMKEQLSKIEAQEEKVLSTSSLKDNVIVYHPLTIEKDLFKNCIQPKTRFFSYSIKSLTENSLSCLLKGDEDNEGVSSALRNIKKLSDDEDWIDLLWNLKNKNDKFSNPYPLSVDNDKPTISRIIRNSQSLEENPFIQPASSILNLDFKQLINDNTYRHLFSTEFINDTRLRYLSIILLLDSIKKEIDNGNNKKPILLVLEEIQNHIPKEEQKRQSYHNQLLKTIDNLMAILRSQNVTMILTSQNLTRTPKEITSLSETWFIFRPSQNDLRYLFKSEDIDREEKVKIGQTTRGQFIYYKRTKQKYWIDDIHLTYIPSHAIQYEGQKYRDLYKKYYPEDMINYKNFLKEVKKVQDDMLNKGVEKYDAEQEVLRKEKIAKEKVDNADVLKERLEEELSLQKKITINQTNQEIYNTLKIIIEENKKGIMQHKSLWTELEKRMNIKGINKTRPTLKKIAINTAIISKDTETIEYLNKN